jgi:hypothetical protein
MSDTYGPPEGAFLPQGSQVKADRGPLADEPNAEAAPVELKRAPSSSGRYLVTVLIAAVVSLVVSGTVATVISVGFNLGMTKPGGADSGRLTQEGKLMVGQGERVVFYAEPFAGPPKLELDGQMVFITLKEQKADHFTIHSAVHTEVRWRAEGMRIPK